MRISDLTPRAQQLHALTDFDPIALVTQLLAEEGHPSPSAWLAYVSPEANDPNLPNNVKRAYVNRAWRTIFGRYQMDSGINTEHPRYCLVDSGELNVWLVLFYQSVVPAIVEHKLPT